MCLSIVAVHRAEPWTKLQMRRALVCRQALSTEGPPNAEGMPTFDPRPQARGKEMTDCGPDMMTCPKMAGQGFGNGFWFWVLDQEGFSCPQNETLSLSYVDWHGRSSGADQLRSRIVGGPASAIEGRPCAGAHGDACQRRCGCPYVERAADSASRGQAEALGGQAS
jgi:hypothetical protein